MFDVVPRNSTSFRGAMLSQRQITRFKPDPVPREAIEKIIESATKAPSGGNSQPWHFVANTDPDLIARIGGIYKEPRLGARGPQAQPGETPVYRRRGTWLTTCQKCRP